MSLNLEQEIFELVAWLEIDRLTERILAMKPRSFSRMQAEVRLARLMNAKLIRENLDKPTFPPVDNDPSSLKFNGRAA